MQPPLNRNTWSQVFVPLTIGGGIRAYTDSDGNKVSGLDVASRYFRAGADKVSLGSDAVEAVKGFIANGRQPTTPFASVPLD